MGRGVRYGSMKIRGERECTECGTRWSYYDSGSIACPSCGSLRSVGVDERREHTAGAASLDLSPVRHLVDEETLETVAEEAESRCREYVRKSGFVHGGELRLLDDTYLAAAELRHVAAEISRAMRVSDDEEYYFLTLLRGADQGERPEFDELPDSLRGARGLAYAEAVDAYRADVRRYLEDHPDELASRLLGTLGEHQKRVAALDGDVDPRSVEHLVRVARDIGRALAEGDEGALAEAQGRLDGLDLKT